MAYEKHNTPFRIWYALLQRHSSSSKYNTHYYAQSSGQLNSADTAAWGGVIGNIKNLSKIWPDQLQIEVVVHGRALDFLVASKSHLVNDVEQLSKKGIIFSACENTMGKYGITKQMLIPAVFTVPSGVGEVILKQEQGWSYLRAGY